MTRGVTPRITPCRAKQLTAEEFLFASRTAIDIDRSYENYRSTFDTFLPYGDFRALILGEHWQPAGDGTDTTEETQYTFLDISTHGFRAKGYGDWSSGTLALFDLSYSFVPQGLEDLLVLLGSSYFTDVESGRLYAGLTDISLSEGLSLDVVVEATGAENFDGVHDGSVALELRNRPYDWAGFNYSLAASLRIDKEAHLLPGARATLGFPRLFYNTQIELGISYDYIDVVRRIPRENTFAFLVGFNTLITDR